MSLPRCALAVTLLLCCALALRAQDTTTLDGEPAIRFLVGHAHIGDWCEGVIYVTPTRVRYVGVANPPLHTIDYHKREIGGFHVGRLLGWNYIKMEAGGKTWRFLVYPDLARQYGDRTAFLERAYTDFTGASAEIAKAEAARSLPKELIQARVTPAGAMLAFPAIAGPGRFAFRGGDFKDWTIEATPNYSGSPYVEIEGSASVGTLEISADRVRFASGVGQGEYSFDAAKSNVELIAAASGYPHVIARVGGAGQVNIVFAEPTGQTVTFRGKTVAAKRFYDAAPILRALGPEFPQMAAELLPKPMVIVAANQPDAEVFVDEKRRGVTGSDGMLRLAALEPGDHELRATAKGCFPWSGKVSVAPGEEKKVEVKLEPVPPPPLAEATKPAGAPPLHLAEVIKMLEGGVTPRRVGKVVEKDGVDFALDNEAERRIRAAGGDSDLLVVIAKSKR